MGGEWYNGCSGVLSLDRQFLFLTDGAITHSQYDNAFNNHQNPEITFEEFKAKYVQILPPHIDEIPFIEMEVRDFDDDEWERKKVVCVSDDGCNAISENGCFFVFWNQYRPI